MLKTAFKQGFIDGSFAVTSGAEPLKPLPVLIESEEDLLKTYNLHANCYIKKPVDIVEFEKIVNSIGNFWFSIVILPENKQ